MESDKRIVFTNAQLRDVFFDILKNKFGTWRVIQQRYNIHKSVLEYYRNGKRTMPQTLFLKLLHNIDKNSREKLVKKIKYLDKHWGQRKGGLRTYKDHKEIYKKGRHAAVKKRIKQCSPLSEVSESFYELIGAFIGDGFANKYCNSYIVQFTGHQKLDWKYFKTILIPIILLNFPHCKPKMTFNGNVLRLTIYSKKMYLTLTQTFGLKSGKKARTVSIPAQIIDKKKSCINCIRGIFDTDGSVYFDKRAKTPWPRIELHMTSKKLITQVSSVLSSWSINVKVNSNRTRLHINGKTDCLKFNKVISFSNERHIKKMELIKKSTNRNK